eukprot:TRINITY_DN8983_c0_g1_i1.p2 TRINITY_DN8983_c0_g1~~TRINITY_DN8983_c0_g1_i1.p2  ORF type:complete len:208 (+),score=47.93 TRINITY_DN8983_c0_g1_i1:85-708(+)
MSLSDMGSAELSTKGATHLLSLTTKVMLRKLKKKPMEKILVVSTFQSNGAKTRANSKQKTLIDHPDKAKPILNVFLATNMGIMQKTAPSEELRIGTTPDQGPSHVLLAENDTRERINPNLEVVPERGADPDLPLLVTKKEIYLQNLSILRRGEGKKEAIVLLQDIIAKEEINQMKKKREITTTTKMPKKNLKKDLVKSRTDQKKTTR